MSYEKIVEWCVVKIDRPLYSRNIAARSWYFGEECVQRCGHFDVTRWDRSTGLATERDDDGCDVSVMRHTISSNTASQP